VALEENTTLKYMHQDHLTGTSLMTDTDGAQIGTTMKYLPFGECLNSPPNLPTDKLFTGQRLDGTGLYYFNARYYDPLIGRFISPDTIIPHPANPQSFNRYSYCLNNPLKYIDPSGHSPGDDYMRLIDVAGQAQKLQQITEQINSSSGGNTPGWVGEYLNEQRKNIRKEVEKIWKNAEPKTPSPSLPTGSNTENNKPSLPVDKDGWKWDDPKAVAAFAIALGLVADDIPSGGIGVVDDPIAGLVALAGLGISVWENKEIISDAIDSAIMWLAEHTQNRTKANWDKHSKKDPGAPEKGDARRTPRNPPKKH
jgi:RHS repeat-associated protein